MSIDPLRAASTLCREASAWLRRLPAPVFALGIIILAVLRWGATIGPVFTEMFRNAARVFPEPYGWMDSSLGVIILMKLLHYPSERVWNWVGYLGFAAMAGTAILLARRAGSWRREALVLITLSPAFGVLTNVMGHYDYFTLIGSALAATARRVRWVVLAAVMAVLGNPEQVLVGAFCLGLVCFAYPKLSRNAVVLGVVATAWLAGLHLLYGGGSARITASSDPVFLLTGVRRFLADWPLALWAFLGPLWVVVIISLRLVRRFRAIAAAAGVVVIPAAISILTIDGTRVFVAVSCAALSGLVVATWRTHWSGVAPPPALLGILALAFLATPAINLFPGAPGLLLQPYDFQLSANGGWGMTPEKYSVMPDWWIWSWG